MTSRGAGILAACVAVALGGVGLFFGVRDTPGSVTSRPADTAVDDERPMAEAPATAIVQTTTTAVPSTTLEPVAVPNVVGSKVDSAVERLDDFTVTVNTTLTTEPDTVEQVTSQTPAFGETVAPGGTVVIEAIVRPTPNTVPADPDRFDLGDDLDDLHNVPPGSCAVIVRPADGGEQVHTLVDCAEPHDVEVYTTYDLADIDPLPDDFDWDFGPLQICNSFYADYIGSSTKDTKLAFQYQAPNEEEFRSGDTQVTCAVSAGRDGQLVGSARGTFW